ncbi:RHS repeat-associated core domain-containing protein [Streptacidiphilus sp. MAP12-16]|uniref:RHS repeat-associated core domain-containing protein n=1 Tax=Streptacidiphilus sp. MAP12-16 TaxID=3156300 RepID=UPI00351239D5
MPVRQLPQRVPSPNYKATATHWPAAASSTLPIGTARSRATGSPVWGQALPDPKGVYAGPSSLGVKVLSRSAAAAAGVSGVLAQVTPAGAGRGAVRVGVDYSSFAQAYGGDYQGRLRLVQLPACALTTPQVASCRVQTPLAAVNDTVTKSLSATVTLGPAPLAATAAKTPASVTGVALAANTAGAMVLAMTSAPSSGDGGSSGGQYGATSLKASATWSAGSSSGSFDYTYPISVPPAHSRLTPSIDLNYDSGSVDGQTAATQAQSSWVGDGWSTADSYVEQSFTSCSATPEGVTLPPADQTGDMCYDGPILTLSLLGSSVSLVKDSTGAWHTTNDNGDVVTHVTGSGNGSGTYNTDYWTVKDRSGTVYTFGRNELPGWSTGRATTNSVDSEPVYGANPTDPCNSTSGFTSSVCTMAYRWHLDYVKDLHGNAMSYYYKQDTNYYGEDNGAHNVSYVRDSHLDHIDYGFTDGNAYGTIADKVVYTTGERCFSGTCDPIASNTANWPDVPADLICVYGATCSSYGPGFFSTVRLTGITTEQWNGSSYVPPVDTWALGQSIPTTGTYNTSTVRLDSILRTGNDTTAGGSAVPLPPVKFGYQMTANRVNYTTGTGSGLGPLNRYRLNAITTESGSNISVVYELVDPCTATSIASLTPSTNTASCFPVEWTPPTTGSPYLDWFNKYSVQSVSQSDPSGGSAGLFTAYTYLGHGAWHYDDNELAKAKYRTYGQWRGYADVQTRTGQGTDPVTESETWYYRGMNGDWLSSTSTRSVSLTDSQGSTHTDSNQLAGNTMESKAYTYNNGPVDHSTINSYWVSPATATRTRTALPALTANAVGQVESWSRQLVTSGTPTTWRKTETDTSYDTTASSPTFGLPLLTYSHGDLALAGTGSSQETCTQTTYAPANTSLNLAGLVAETEIDDKACGGTSPAGSSAPTAAQTNALAAPTSLNKATDVVSDTRTFYNNPTMAATWPQPASPTWPQAAPALGDISVAQTATGYSGGQFTYQTKSASLYDGYGRQTASYDANGNKNSSAYTDTTYLTTTAIKTTNVLGQTGTTTLDPERNLPELMTDANGVVTTVHSDGLGRVIAVWTDSRTTGSPANLLYTYAFPASGTTAPVVVTTQTMNDSSGYSTSTTLYDALMRVRQTQAQAVSTTAGRIISDTFYDTHGWVYKTNANYSDNTASPNGTMVTVADNYSHQQTLTTRDGLGRPTVVTSLADSLAKQTAYNQYQGDRTITVPPTGGVATASVVDALGRTTEKDEYSTSPTVTTTTTGGFTTAAITSGTTQATKYTFNAQGRAYQTIDAAGDTWSTGYNFLGQPVTQSDPDAGSTPANSPTLYDPAGNILQSTDSAGHTHSFTYDQLNRKTAEYDTTLANQPSNQIASWVYDNSTNVSGVTNPIGHLTTTTSYTTAGNFTVQATGFNIFGESLGETYTVPGTSLLAGNYAYQHTYTPTTGLPKATLIPAAGGMAAEAPTIGYCAYSGLDEPCTLGGTNGYTQNVAYTDLGQVAQELIGSATNQATVSNTYDTHTGALNDQNVVNTAVSSTPMDDTSYGFDPSGNITSQTDLRNGTTTETQCYNFDPLDRLSQAWTTASTASSCSTQPTSSNVTTTVGDGVTGSAYWTSWTYDVLGQPKAQTQHSLTAGTDTRTDYAYGGSASGCTTSTGAHTLATATTTGGTSSTSTYCYDGLGNTTSRTTPAGQQSLAWNDEGKLQTATTGSNATSYTYDTAGNVIERTDPGPITTLFLPDQQITLYTNNSSLNAVRSYPLPGGGQAVLTNSNYSFTLSDQHNTATLSLDSTAKNPSWKQYTPYGAPRGTTPGSSWLNPNGYLDKPQDTSDALTTIGARQYDTTLGRFISLDPVLETSSPQQLNGYTYAGSNPITNSDPTGLDPAGYNGNCDYAGTNCPPPPTPTTTTGSTGSTGSGKPVIGRSKDGQPTIDGIRLKTFKELAASQGGNQSYGQMIGRWAQGICGSVGSASDAHYAKFCMDVNKAGLLGGTNGGAQDDPLGIQDAYHCFTQGKHCVAAFFKIGLVVLTLVVPPAGEGAEATLAATTVEEVGAATTAEGADSAVSNLLDLCTTHSFLPDTDVLMADGTVKKIKDIKAGDFVVATDPDTGKTQPRVVQKLITTLDDRNFADLTIATTKGPAHLTATDTHPFWVANDHAWITAQNLRPGMALRSVDGTATLILAVRHFQQALRTNDLTIATTHTYYVEAGDTAVLVHNTSCPAGFDFEAASQSGMRADKNGLTRVGREYQKHMGRGELPTVGGKGLDGAGQTLLDGILTDPNADFQLVTGGGFSGGYRIIGNDVVNGRFVGATFDANGNFQYFGVYP